MGTRYLASLLFGFDARDPVSFTSAAAFLVCIALLATLQPAWRAHGSIRWRRSGRNEQLPA